ncbi:hypothetical protein ABEF95_005943 [Exophiala dermatitidis]
MRRTLVRFAQSLHGGQAKTFEKSNTNSNINLIQIRNGTFYKDHPLSHHGDSSTANPPLFPNLTYELPATTVQQEERNQPRKDQHWAVIAANDGTTFLEILRGSYVCIPPNARSYPYLSSEEIERKDHRLRVPSRAIQYVGFNTNGKGQTSSGGIRGAYLSARYESRREETDWTVLQYLRGETELNPAKEDGSHVDEQLLHKVMSDLRLHKLADMPVSNLSNGQTRRARIAKALLGKPELLLLDEPFMGLDPPTLVTLSPMLRELAYRSSPLLLLALRPQDPIPDWITHLVVLGHNHTVALMGDKDRVLFSLCRWLKLAAAATTTNNVSLSGRLDREMARRMLTAYGPPPAGVGDVLSERGIAKHPIFQHVQDPSFEEQYLIHDGIVDPTKLSAEDAERVELARQRLQETAADTNNARLEDLLTLAATIPADLVGRGATEQPSSTPSVSTAHSSPQVSSSTGAENNSASDKQQSRSRPLGKPLIELQSVIVKYGDKVVLGHGAAQPGYSEPGLNLTIRQGTRLALLGPNGSGKTTLLSLLTSDHPQSYSLPIKFFGRSRLPERGQPGLSLWEIQSRIGHSSPEIHAFFPRHLPVRRVLESAWAETYAGKPQMTVERSALVDGVLKWWEPELRQDGSSSDLSWATDKQTHAFGSLPFGTQRLLLLLRALIKQPDIVILDEAFSGLSAETRDKAMMWLEHGERESEYESSSGSRSVSDSSSDSGSTSVSESDSKSQSQTTNKSVSDSDNETKKTNGFPGLLPTQALVVVSHVKEEIPPMVDEWVRLPGEDEVSEHGRGVEVGRSATRGDIRTNEGWMRVWGL